MALVVGLDQVERVAEVFQVVPLVCGGAVAEPFNEVLNNWATASRLDPAAKQSFNLICRGFVILCGDRTWFVVPRSVEGVRFLRDAFQVGD